MHKMNSRYYTAEREEAAQRKPEKLSGLWTELQKSNKLPRSSLTASCQDELQELMKQLDIMVSTKKQEMNRELEQMQSQLDTKDKELKLRTKEVEELKNQLEGGNKTQKEIVNEYEVQLAKLKSEVQKMKREYEKLYRRHSKQTKEIEKHKDRLNSEQDNTSELKKLVEKNEELHQKNKDFELERRSLIKQIETLEIQKKGISEKCEFIQQQSETYQSQLERRRQMQDNTELNMKSKIATFESQIHRYKTVLTVQKEKIEKLKLALDEALNSHKRAMSDNEKLLEDLRKANLANRRLESDNSKLVSDVQSKTDLLRVAEEDTSQYAKDVTRLEQTISAKDDIIRNIGESNRKEESEQLSLLKQSYTEAKEEIRSCKKLEKKLKVELNHLEEKYQQLLSANDETLRSLQQKEEDLEYLKNTEIQKLTSEIQKLEENSDSVAGNHRAELSGMRLRLSKLTTELHHRDVTMASMSERSSNMEKQLREETEKAEKKVAELQVSNAQVEALRLENSHLREEFINKLGDVCGKAEAEKHLNSLNSQYGQTIFKLERENGQLKHDVSSLKEEINELERKFSEQLNNVNRNTSITLDRITVNNSQDIDKILDNDRTLDNSKDSTLNHYEQQLQLICEQKKRLEEELHIQKRENMKLMNEVSKSHGHGAGDTSFLTVADSVDMSLCSKSDFGDLVGRLVSEDHAQEIADKFLEEEQERTIALENLIESHIEKFKLGTQGTLKKYNYMSS